LPDSIPRTNLLADCGNCLGLCCVALPFGKSADFAFDKAAGSPCVNLDENFRCGIHARLRNSGFTGCTVYDCFGAGQRVSGHTYAGRSWRDDPGTATGMVAVFQVVRDLHELLWYLRQAAELAVPPDLWAELRAALAATDALALSDPAELLRLDLIAHRGAVDELLLRTSSHHRAGARGPAPICAEPTCAAPTSSERICAGPTFGGPTASGRTSAVPGCTTRTCRTPSSSPSSNSTPLPGIRTPACRRF